MRELNVSKITEAVKELGIKFSESGDVVPNPSIELVRKLVAQGKEDKVEKQEIVVNGLPEGQAWLKYFKVGNDTYYISLVNPNDWKTGSNKIQAYISKKSNPITTPYALATETFTVEIDPRMPDMGNHTSPDNTPLVKQKDGSYQGNVNLTMTGLWRIHFTVKDDKGNVVAGGEEGLSSLYWDVTI